MRFKRFMWVRGPSGHRFHIKFGNTAEGLTKCGIPAGRGWRWKVGLGSRDKRCLNCLR